MYSFEISTFFPPPPLLLFLNKCPRKSYEFEDLLQSSSENGRVDWYAQSKMALTRTLSEENVYEDILGRILEMKSNYGDLTACMLTLWMSEYLVQVYVVFFKPMVLV